MAGYPTKPGEEKVWPRDATFKARPVPSKGSSSATMSFQPCMTYIRGHVPAFQAFQRTTPMKRLATLVILGTTPMKRLAILVILVILVILATFALVLAAGGPQGA